MLHRTTHFVEGDTVNASDVTRKRPASVTVTTGVHPVVFQISLGAAIWFIIVSWIYFAWDADVDLDLAVVSGYFIVFFSLFLIMAVGIIKDPRWHQKKTSFREFLHSKVPTYTGEISGRDVLIGITLIPVSLAFAASIIGLAWAYLH